MGRLKPWEMQPWNKDDTDIVMPSLFRSFWTKWGALRFGRKTFYHGVIWNRNDPLRTEVEW